MFSSQSRNTGTAIRKLKDFIQSLRQNRVMLVKLPSPLSPVVSKLICQSDRTQPQRLIDGRPPVVLVFINRNRFFRAGTAKPLNDVGCLFNFLYQRRQIFAWIIFGMKIPERSGQCFLQTFRVEQISIHHVRIIEVPALCPQLQVRNIPY